VGVNKVMTLVFSLGYIPEDKDFMLQLKDFSFSVLSHDSLLEELMKLKPRLSLSEKSI
jgi:hypothetical protein